MRVLGLMFVVALMGCADAINQYPVTSETTDYEKISANDAIVIAEEHLKSLNVDHSNYRVKAKWYPDAWWVMYEDVVPKPGGHFVVLVSHDRKVIEILPGQ